MIKYLGCEHFVSDSSLLVLDDLPDLELRKSILCGQFDLLTEDKEILEKPAL